MKHESELIERTSFKLCFWKKIKERKLRSEPHLGKSKVTDIHI